MSRFTKVSPYKTGAPRYGRKSEKFDNSVKVSYLSPEELQKYRNGEKGGSKLFTYDDYQALKAAGKSNDEIAKEMKISVPTLYNRLKVWKKEPINKPAEKAPVAPIREKDVLKGQISQNDKSREYELLIGELNGKLKASNENAKEKDSLIVELEKEIAHWKDHSKKVSEAPADNKDVEALKKELISVHEQVSWLQVKLNESDDVFNEVMGMKENLQKELLIFENKYERLKETHLELKDFYDALKRKYRELDQEVAPLRQLAYLKLKTDVGA